MSDLNEVILDSIKDKIQTAVLSAMAGDEIMGALVQKALERPVEVPKATGYGTERMPFMQHVVEDTVKFATERAVREWVREREDQITAAVRSQLEARVDEIANGLIGAAIRDEYSSMVIKVELPRGR